MARLSNTGQVMLLTFVALTACSTQTPSFDALAQARDVPGVEARAVKELSGKFAFLRSNGAYGTGMFGWHAAKLADVSGRREYIVFTTPLTSEDIGEQVFELSNGELTKYIPEDETFAMRVIKHSFDVRFDISAKRADFSDTVTFAREGAKRDSFMFRMSPNYRLLSLADSHGKNVKFAQAGGVVCVPVPDEEIFTWELAYTATVDAPGYAGSISANEATLTNDYWWPMIARQPAPYDLAAQVPKGWVAVGQGIKKELADGKVSFSMKLPVSVYSFSVGAYKQYSSKIGGRNYFVWGFESTREGAAIQADLYHPIIEFYSKTFSRYPFDYFGALLSPRYGGGALEAYSYATYGDSGEIVGEDAHEPAHTWWGGIIPNTYLHSLWNESFAVYSDGLYSREGAPGNKEERRLAFAQIPRYSRAWEASALANASPLIGPAAGDLGYGKGAYVLQLLEQELGTEMMTATLRNWIKSHKLGTSGEWEDYEKAVSAIAGKSYKWFFDQWLRRKGAPSLAVTNLRWNDGRLRGNLNFEGMEYRLSIETLLIFDNSSKTIHLETQEMKRVSQNTLSFDVPCEKKPKVVSIDPWLRIPRAIASDETPLGAAGAMWSFAKYTDGKHTDWLSQVGRSRGASPPADLNGTFVVGHPDTMPRMRELCAKAGFQVTGDHLTWNGTTIDLREGAALAVVELGDGKRCLIGLGKTLLAPNPGRSRLCLTDRYGRFIRGLTEPKTSGALTHRID